MVKTYTAKSVSGNHDWKFVVSNGQITNLIITSEVNYGEIGMAEGKDIWVALNATQKDKIQQAYDLVNQWYNNQFL